MFFVELFTSRIPKKTRTIWVELFHSIIAQKNSTAKFQKNENDFW